MSSITLNPNLEAELAKSAEIKRILKEKADKGADYARSIAPVDTGRYRESIHVEESGDGYAIVADAVTPEGHPYSVPVEVGTSDTPAHHTLSRTGAALERL